MLIAGCCVLLLGEFLLLGKVLLVASIEDVVLLVREKPILGLIVERLVNELVKLLLLLVWLFSSYLGLHVEARLRRLLLELGEDHLAALGTGLRLWDDLMLGFLRWFVFDDHGVALNPDIAPESVAELVSTRAGETPVRDEGAGSAGGSQQDREASLFAWGNLGVASRALAGRDELVNASRALGVHGAHVVTASELHGAAGRPRLRAAVAEVPRLLEDGVGWDHRSIGDGITDEVCNQIFLAGSSRELLGLDDLGSIRLGLGWLEVSDGLDLRGGVGGRGGGRLGRLGHGAALSVAHHRHGSAIIVVTHGGDRHVADRSLELDEGVGLVVRVGRVGLAAGTEVGIVADGALVAVSRDVGLANLGGVAERTIAVDAEVAGTVHVPDPGIRGLVQRDKPMDGVDVPDIDKAGRAVVPVWAVNALVAHAIDVLVAPVADGIVAPVAAGPEQGLGN